MLSATAAFSVCACTSRETRTASAFEVESARVHAVFDKLIAADNRGDLNAVMDCYAEDIALLPPQGQPIRGPAAVREHYAGLFARDRLEVRIVFGETMLSGSGAVVRGRTTGRRIANADGGANAIDDEFEAALRRGADREWRIQRLRWW